MPIPLRYLQIGLGRLLLGAHWQAPCRSKAANLNSAEQFEFVTPPAAVISRLRAAAPQWGDRAHCRGYIRT